MPETTTTALNVCLTLTITLALALAGPGLALHCNGDITTIGAGNETFYIDDRSETGEVHVWIYQETNGIEGLQSGRDDHDTGVFQFVDPCQHPLPDGLILL